MSEITIQQLKTINEYRQSHNIGSVYSNEAVADMIKEEMEKTGAVYPGFEALIENCNKSQKTNSPSPISLFECNNEEVEIHGISRNPTQQELNTIKFLQDLLISARQSIDEFDKTSRWHTDFASWCFNHKYRKQDVEAALKDTEKDIEMLLKAAQGLLYDKHIMVGDTAVLFSEAFKRCRGVEYNEANISACQKKAQNFSYVKSYYEKITMIQDELQKMNAISGININELHGKIISALNFAGIKSKPMLEQIIQRYFKPDENYTNDIKLEKNNDGNWRIKIKHQNGHWCDMSYDQLKDVSSEICKVLDMQFCDEMGLEYDKEFPSEKMHELAYEEFDRQQKEYEEAFRQAYGSEDLKVLADNYIVACQKATATLDTIEQVIMMGLMFIPGGGTTAIATKLALTGIMITNPIQAIDKITSENGMSREDWQEYGKQVMMNAAYMGVGMKVGKIAENAAALYKTRAIFNAYKQSGKTVENAMALIKGNVNNFPNELIKSINTIDKISKALQVTSEVAMDITTTYAMNEMFIGEGLSVQDWIMSVATAIAGGALQKTFASMKPEQRIAYLMDAFKDFNITKKDAVNILKQVSDIESGKVKTEKTKTIADAVRESANSAGEETVVKTGNQDKFIADIETSLHTAETREDSAETSEANKRNGKYDDKVLTRTQLARTNRSDIVDSCYKQFSILIKDGEVNDKLLSKTLAFLSDKSDISDSKLQTICDYLVKVSRDYYEKEYININSLLNFINNSVEEFNTKRGIDWYYYEILLDKVSSLDTFSMEKFNRKIEKIFNIMNDKLKNIDNNSYIKIWQNIMNMINNGESNNKAEHYINQILNNAKEIESCIPDKYYDEAICMLFNDNKPISDIKHYFENIVDVDKVFDLLNKEIEQSNQFKIRKNLAYVLPTLLSRGYSLEKIANLIRSKVSIFSQKELSSIINVEDLADIVEKLPEIDAAALMKYADDEVNAGSFDLSFLANVKITRALKSLYRGSSFDALNNIQLENGRMLGDAIKEAISSIKTNNDYTYFNKIRDEVIGSILSQEHQISASTSKDTAFSFVEKYDGFLFDIDTEPSVSGINMTMFNTNLEKDFLFYEPNMIICDIQFDPKTDIVIINAKMVKP